ncbi:serine/threonine protein kinase [Streptomyces adustus]|uniref:non-specific serine/threonine protein kinase n=1 Tax=Streptomyces adustus TaxID=1609272 RepID=A0A5N8VQV2_9ACTN|nr:serine/threonine-protein kinase [Streptomyces adustus]MPY37667.1 serine/threonine protein kinase [Streptomyces adustus]
MSTWTVPGYTESLELGSGASGRVVLAVHRDTGIAVAVKYLSESLYTRPGFVSGFRAEARLLAGLDSPYVTGLYEYVESPDGAAIVMELVDGVSLRALLKREGPLTPEAALVVLKGSLLGLADAHRIGVVHRDYKPENVLVLPDGTSKLVDFGIAVSTGESAGVAGTPSYMAPEQWTGAPASPAGDVYAATATFFECLTGRKPYAGDNLAELALRHLDAPVPYDEVPESVRSLVRQGLAKSAEQRPADAEAFVGELEAAAVHGYGPDWEERGRSRLASLVALLTLLRPPARTGRLSTTDTARTVLRRGWLRAPGLGTGRGHVWRPTLPGVLVSAVVALLLVLLARGVPFGGAPAGERAAEALATTSAGPGTEPGATPAAGTSAAPSGSADPSGSPSPSPSGSGTTTPGGPSATAASSPASVDPPTGPATTTATPTAAPPTVSATPSAPASPSTPGAPAVKAVTLSGFRQTGPSTGTATVTVTTDGTGPLTLVVSWYTGATSGQLGTPDGASQAFERSGATQYTIAVDHTFQGGGCYWSVQATTKPASADGGATQQLLTRGCSLR